MLSKTKNKEASRFYKLIQKVILVQDMMVEVLLHKNKRVLEFTN